MKKIIIDYYKRGIYNDADMQIFIQAGYLTVEEYEAIKYA